MNAKDDHTMDTGRPDKDRLAHDAHQTPRSAEPDAEVLEIRASIAHTRAEMSETIDELQERLNPTHLKEQLKERAAQQYEHAKETVRDATIGKVEDMMQRASDAVNETRKTIMDTIQENPVPSALVGIGLAWLFMNGRSESARGARRQHEQPPGGYYGYDDAPRGYYAAGGSSRGPERRRADDWNRDSGDSEGLSDKAAHAARGMAEHVQETAGHLAERARGTAAGVAEQAHATADYLSEQARYQAQRVEERFHRALHDNPLAVGAIALAVGTAVGLAAPRTRREDEWMGDTRDSLLGRAQTVAHDTLEQVQQVAKEVAQDVKEDVGAKLDERLQGQPSGSARSTSTT